MRKLILLAGLFLLWQISFAQEDSYVALRGGVNAATFHASNGFDYGTLIGGQGGVEIYVPGKRRNTLGLSFLYTVKGNKRDDLPGNVRTSLRYLQADVNFLHTFKTRSKKASLFAGAGFYAAYAVSGRYKSDLGDSKVTFTGPNSNGTFDRVDLGFPLKIGVDARNIIVGLDYDLGVWNILSQGSGKLFNRNFSLYISYPFRSL